MKYPAKEVDIAAVGFGPANIALAIALEELGYQQNVVFFESHHDSIWQQGMLIEDSDIQNHPMRDLVLPSNPRSKYTFMNYLFESGRLFPHLNLGMYFPYRMEYAQYIQWVAAHFKHQVHYGTRINGVMMEEDELGRGVGYRLVDQGGTVFRSRMLVLAPGRTPFIPWPFQAVSSPRVRHITEYLDGVKAVLTGNPTARVAVIGSSQSAVEAILHLSEHYPGARITAIHRSYGYRLKDTSPFTGEVYFPEFVDFFYEASTEEKMRLQRDLYRTNYGAVDGDVLDRLYRRIYMQKLKDEQHIFLHRSADITGARMVEEEVELSFNKIGVQGGLSERFDLVILATGFRNMGTGPEEEYYPPIVRDLLPYMALNDRGCLDINQGYRVMMNKNVADEAGCFLNGLCESSHGMGDAGSFSLLAIRARTIARCLMGLSVSRPLRITTIH